MTLGDALRSDRSRNLDALRLVLAGAVIFSHAWPLALGPGAPEPLEDWTGRALGGWAVGGFFFISGMLITASAQRSGTARFWAARARRIVPGLFVALLATLVLALAGGATPGSAEVLAWFARAITLVSIEHRLTGAFAANPYPEVVNGPLWSLSHEVLAYVLCALFVRAGGARRPATVLAFAALAGAAGMAEGILPGRLATFAPLFAAFTLGMAVYLWRDRIVLTPAVLALGMGLGVLLPWQLAVAAAGFCLVALALLAPLPRLKHDASYGMYIYGWPVAQTIVAVSPQIDPLALAILSIAATYPLALISWSLVERPGLAARKAPA